jgi:hypothetical protein
MTEELKNTIAISRNDLGSVARRNNDEMALVRQSLALTANEYDSADEDDDEEDRISAEAQLSEQMAILEVCQTLFAQLQSMLQDEKIEELAEGRSGKVNVSFGTITNGFGIGVSNAPISNVTFGHPPTGGPKSS